MSLHGRLRILGTLSLAIGLVCAALPILLHTVLQPESVSFWQVVLVLLVGVFTTGLLADLSRHAPPDLGQAPARRFAKIGFLLSILGVAVFIVVPAFQIPFHASIDMKNATNSRQLGIAMHEYATEHGGKLPAHAIYSKEGQPLLSWRVSILPYLGDDERDLYQQFRLDEPWDSPHNLPLLRKMPKVFKRPWPYHEDRTKTYYQVFVGPGALFEGQRVLTLSEVTKGDGLSNTLLLADAAEAVPWTKPADLAFDPQGPLPMLNFQSPYTGAAVCWGDGRARRIRKPQNEAQLRVLRQLITWNGSEWEDTSPIVD